MAALAYVLPPISGLLAYLVATSPRVRFHGLQAIVVGAVWPSAVYLGAVFSPTLTLGVFLIGGLVWVALLLATAFGLDIALPGIAHRLRLAVSYEVTRGRID